MFEAIADPQLVDHGWTWCWALVERGADGRIVREVAYFQDEDCCRACARALNETREREREEQHT